MLGKGQQVCELGAPANRSSREELIGWAAAEPARRGQEWGLYTAVYADLRHDEEGEDAEPAEGRCFREELLLWNRARVLLRKADDRAVC